jgi:hypothetical protein
VPYGQAGFNLLDGKYVSSCGPRETEFKPVPEPEAAKLLAAAKLYEHHWHRRAHVLARDDRGRYFYIDRSNASPDAQGFRVYAGPKGSLTPLRMTNVVSDSYGEIFTTRDGQLRLVLNRSKEDTGDVKRDYTWVSGKTTTRLLSVPVDENGPLIYNDLGVYAGQRLGTPCDDL